MASRTKLIGVQEYDRDGGLDYFICGTDWQEWYRWRLQSKSKEEIRQEILTKFELALNRAMEFKGA